MPVYVQAFAGTHSAYPQMGGQDELIWVAGYIQRWFACLKMVTHPSTSHPQCKVTLLIKTNMLPLSQLVQLKSHAKEIFEEFLQISLHFLQ